MFETVWIRNHPCLLTNLLILSLLFGCNNPDEKKSNLQAKPMPIYKLAYWKEFGNYSYNYFFDPADNSITVLTDSVDIPAWEHMLRTNNRENEFSDSIAYTSFKTFYSLQYCLVNDSFQLCADSVFRHCNKPLIISRGFSSTRLDTNAEFSQNEFPASSVLRRLSAQESYSENIAARDKDSVLLYLSGDPFNYILYDTILDLNNDSIGEHLFFYASTDLHKYMMIAGNTDGEWKALQKQQVVLYYDSYFHIQLVKLKDKKSNGIFISTLSVNPSPFAFPPGRVYEDLLVFIPQ